MAEAGIEGPKPSVRLGMQGIGLRFAFCYVALYYGPVLVGVVPGAGYLVGWSSLLRDKLVGLILGRLVGLDSYPVRYTGSGDTVANYLIQILILVVAIASALVWGFLDRGRPRAVSLAGWLRVLVRYALAFSLMEYALVKIIPVQFFPLQARQLAESYGQSSPMRLLWNFMGFSTAYTVFGGVAELLPALLLLFRRTALAGALIAFGVLLNVVMLNFCYDVPVKLYSLNLLLLCLLLLVPESGRLLRFFILNRPVEPADLIGPGLGDARVRRGGVVLKYLLIVCLIGEIAFASMKHYREMSDRGAPPPTPLTTRGFHWVQEDPYNR